jgi:hydroxymethylglutaryl-CoA lyase
MSVVYDYQKLNMQKDNIGIEIDRVVVLEVGPRDGFQNITTFIPTPRKIQIIEGIIHAGLDTIQLTSFVSPKAVPQMKDAAEVTKTILDQYGPRRFSALVPNYRGAQIAYETGIRRISYVISVSESHNRKNVGMDRYTSWEQLRKISKDFSDLSIRLDLATVFSCPFEGEIRLGEAMEQVKLGTAAGFAEISLSDTMGTANPLQTKRVLAAMKNEFPEVEFTLHFHDTQGMALLNYFIAAQLGFTHFESSLAGLGGCPFAPGATGNLATEDLVNMFESIGVNTCVDLEKLLEAAAIVREHIEPHPSGRLARKSGQQ